MASNKELLEQQEELKRISAENELKYQKLLEDMQAIILERDGLKEKLKKKAAPKTTKDTFDGLTASVFIRALAKKDFETTKIHHALCGVGLDANSSVQSQKWEFGKMVKANDAEGIAEVPDLSDEQLQRVEDGCVAFEEFLKGRYALNNGKVEEEVAAAS